jgi:signal transduction histidine kinase
MFAGSQGARKNLTKRGVGEVNADAATFLGGDHILLGATLWALTVSMRVARKWRREVGSQVRGAVNRERERIARELHDVVAHHLTIMVAGASAAKRGLTLDTATLALGTVETVGRDALVEMRRLLGRLHIDQEAAGPPSLDQLPTLIARVEQAGLPVRLTVWGDRRPLPDNIDENAYRIVQEALTNTLRHAGPTQAGIEIGYPPGALQLRIYDLGIGGIPKPGGCGLDGMRCRVARLGGQILVGPAPQGGFQVAVDLPVNSPRP